MIGKLGAAGWELVPDASDADAIVVNTCAFIDPAKAESTDVILEHAQRKRPGQQLIVAGCLSQRFGTELQSLIPEIDGVVGTGAYAGIVELLDDAQAGKRPVRLDFEAEPEHDFLPRLITTPSATAYLQDRRRLRSSVHVLHHPAIARRLPLAFGRIDSDGSARAGGRGHAKS